jgi:ABC-type antimicrobial peptide transport system permease subunit
LIVIKTAITSVDERIVEIGIFRAVGWGNKDIYKLLSAEMLIQSFFGTILGCVVGELIIYFWTRTVTLEIPTAMNPFPCVPCIPMPTKLVVPFDLSVNLILFSFAFAVVVAILSVWIAARRVLKYEPIENLRRR